MYGMLCSRWSHGLDSRIWFLPVDGQDISVCLLCYYHSRVGRMKAFEGRWVARDPSWSESSYDGPHTWDIGRCCTPNTKHLPSHSYRDGSTSGCQRTQMLRNGPWHHLPHPLCLYGKGDKHKYFWVIYFNSNWVVSTFKNIIIRWELNKLMNDSIQTLFTDEIYLDTNTDNNNSPNII